MDIYMSLSDMNCAYKNIYKHIVIYVYIYFNEIYAYLVKKHI